MNRETILNIKHITTIILEIRFQGKENKHNGTNLSPKTEESNYKNNLQLFLTFGNNNKHFQQ